MKCVRNGVFETNSSSCHSLVIKKTNVYYTEEELHDEFRWRMKDGVWKIWDDDDLVFGRYPFQCLATFESKVRYAIAALCCWKEQKDKFEEIENIVNEVLSECVRIELPKTIHWYNDEEVDFYGSVEEDILTPFLKHYNISLKEFLTNRKYVVICDGDEYCIWDNVKRAGLVNMNEIDEEWR